MNPTAVYTVVFSPTGTSRKIAAAVAQGAARHDGSSNAAANAAAGADAGTNAVAGSAAKAFTTIDLTHAAGKSVTLSADAAAVFAVPVYGGRVAPAALERLREIRGEGTPAVVLAVYGNRAFGTAVAQLAAFVAERGFVPVAAGAFVGEHSYSTPGTPIAEGRPDAQDLAEAAAFGARIGQKLAHGETGPIDAAKLRAAYAAVVKTAVHPFRAGVPQAAETQSGRTAPRGRRRTVHPMRPLCRTLSHAGDRARRRTAHRPGALHPLLCMRQRLRVRRTHVRNAFRRRSVAQLRPAETARNAYVI